MMQAGTVGQGAEADQAMGSALARLFAIAELPESKS